MNTKLVSLALLCMTLTAALAGVAVAQDGTATPTTTPTEGENETVTTEIQLSPTTSVTGWTFDRGNSTFHVDIRSKTPTRVTVVDAGAMFEALSARDGSSSAALTMRSYSINPGRQTISFAASTVDGESAVTLTALGGQQMGLLRSGAMGDDRAPVAWATAQALAGGVAITTAGGTYLYIRKRRNDQDVQIRREL
jgi:hypothetical protein